MSSKDRILQFLSIKGISKREFYIRTGLSNGFLDKTNNIGSDKIEIIISCYPELSITWVITGKGKMLLYDAQDNAQDNAQLFPNVHTNTVHNSGYIGGNVKNGKYNIDMGKTKIGHINDFSNTKEPIAQYNSFTQEPNYEGSTIDVNIILDRIKTLLNIETDIELANLINVKPVTFSAWRTRNSLNFEAILKLAKLEKLDLHYIFHGEPIKNANNEILTKQIEQQRIDIGKLQAQIEVLKSIIQK